MLKFNKNMFNKKVLYSVVAVVGLVVLFPQISFGAEQFSRDLSFGFQQDSDVTKLQEFLSDEGLYSGPITGNFFSLTLKAVKTFQSREGITPAAGYFGPKTRVRANTLLGAQIQTSNQQAIAETRQNIVQSATPQTTNNSISNIQSQLNHLLKQINLLQQQLQAQQQAQTQISEITTVVPTNQAPTNAFEIISVSISPDIISARIRWQTTQPADSKVSVYKSDGSSPPLVFASENKFSTSHFADIKDLTANTTYSYDVTATNALGSIKKNGNFSTPRTLVEISSDKDGVKNDGVDYATLTIKTVLENGQVLPNKEIRINDQPYVSDGNGVIIYRTTPTREYCDLRMFINVSDGTKYYTKELRIINIQTGHGMCA